MKVIDAFDLPRQKKTFGEVGLEIEVEGTSLPNLGGLWRCDQDGSLRGVENVEYVLNRPLSLGDVRNALDELERAYISHDTVVDETVRAGVHVHLNCQGMTMLQLYTFMTVYITLENVLVRHCGEFREGNLFCLRCCDAEYLITELVASARDKQFMPHFSTDTLRYSSMNVLALPTYGSLEFRAMRGTRDLDVIYDWVRVLYELQHTSFEFNNPSQVIESVSLLGEEGFLKRCLPETWRVLDDVEEKPRLIHEGMRFAQLLGFSVSWNDWEPEDIPQVKPFIVDPIHVEQNYDNIAYIIDPEEDV